MMKSPTKLFVRAALAVALVVCSFQAASAGTILKLSLGNTGPDVEYTGGTAGVFSTVDDGAMPVTTGEQNTAIDFVGELSFLTDVLTPTASYTLNGVTASGLASDINGQVEQLFSGGEFQLYDDSNILLLDVDLTSSAFSGFVGSDTGAEFSINDGFVVGGTLAQYLVTNTVSFSIALTDIGPGGLAVTPLGLPIVVPGFVIQPATVKAFTADADKLIAADVVPEPGSVLLPIFAGLSAVAMIRRRAAWRRVYS